MVAMLRLERSAERRAGSSPASGTKYGSISFTRKRPGVRLQVEVPIISKLLYNIIC